MPSGPAMLTPSIAALLLPLLAGAAPPHARLTATLDPLNVSGNTVFRRPCVSPTLRPGGEAQAAANTAAVQHSVDSCGAAGGGVVELPTGDYVVGCIQLRSKIELRFGSTYAQRARLVASSNASLYSSSCDAVLYSSSASSGTALTSVAVTGHGAVDGTIAADKLRPLGHKLSTGGSVLFKLAHLCNISTLHLQGVSFLSSPSWHVHLEDCSDVSVTDVTIAGPTGRSETDGLDLDNCRRVHVARVDIGTGDDAIAIKSSAGGVTEDVLIEDTTLRSKELAFGSSASCRNITVRRSAVGWGIYIKLHRDEVKAPGRSVVSHSILIEDVFTWEVPYPHFNDTYQPCAIAINLDYPCPFNISEYTHVPDYCTNASLAPVPAHTPPRAGNITIRGFSGPSICAGTFVGLAQSPIEGLVMENIDLQPSRAGWQCEHVKGAVVNGAVLPAWPPSCGSSP